MTNYERIIQMSTEEITELLFWSCCQHCAFSFSSCGEAPCREGIAKWLAADSGATTNTVNL